MTYSQDLHLYKSVSIKQATTLPDSKILLPSSKSESNRALIINALGGNKGNLSNLSEARDTQTMMRLLQSNEEELDVLDAGTTMRFLTAYLSATSANKSITGTERMQQRPIGILVDALRHIGAEITYKGKEGYPPLHIKGIEKQASRKVTVRGDVSSQYISALLMIAPALPQGLEIELTGEIGSRPYIDMTRALMAKFGVKTEWDRNTVRIENGTYGAETYMIESDWSGASYWLSIAALSPGTSIKLLGLREDSLQGDKAIIDIMAHLGVSSQFDTDGLIIKGGGKMADFSWDFTHCPDLAQTVAVACAATGITCTMTGLQSLRIKETDRIAALQEQLEKIGAQLQEKDDTWTLIPPASAEWQKETITIDTYDDHRMAMAFAPLALKCALDILDPVVVRKSYPRYWDNLEAAGFEISFR